jgi:GNAT superfamily N-acetyltransferase
MNIVQNEARCRGIKFSVQGDKGSDIARAFLYIMHNDLHERPFGFMEDVYVTEAGENRGKGIGTALVEQVIKTAKKEGCYKLIATSRYSRERVHALYDGIGFYSHGKEFRMDF